MILVTGATGHLGTAVVNQLLHYTPASNIAVFARNAEKASHYAAKGIEVRIGDFDNRDSVPDAVDGVEKLVLIPGVDKHRFEQHKRVIDASKAAGVSHLVYASGAIRDLENAATGKLMASHFQTEEYIKGSGLGFTLMRNNLYTDVLPFYLGKNVFSEGIIFPAGSGMVPYALRSEMGEAIANVLLAKGHQGKTYTITGNHAYSYADIAGILSNISGSKVALSDPSPEEFERHLRQRQVPEFAIPILAAFASDIRAGRFDMITPDLEYLLGRRPADLEESLKQIYGSSDTDEKGFDH